MEDIYRSDPRVDEKNKCASFNGRFRNGQTKKIDCLREMRGKYVTIVKEPPDALEFCEVEVFGYIFRGKIITAYFCFKFKSNLNCVVSVNSLPPPPPTNERCGLLFLPMKGVGCYVSRGERWGLLCLPWRKVGVAMSPHEKWSLLCLPMKGGGCYVSP